MTLYMLLIMHGYILLVSQLRRSAQSTQSVICFRELQNVTTDQLESSIPKSRVDNQPLQTLMYLHFKWVNNTSSKYCTTLYLITLTLGCYYCSC